MIYWFIGQPGCGKTSLAKWLKERFKRLGVPCIRVDGDELREINGNCYNPENFTKEYRISQTEKLQKWLEYIEIQGIDVIVSTVNPYRDVRDKLKLKNKTIEIYVVNSGEHVRKDKSVSDFEPPINNYIEVDTVNKTVDESGEELMKKMFI